MTQGAPEGTPVRARGREAGCASPEAMCRHSGTSWSNRERSSRSNIKGCSRGRGQDRLSVLTLFVMGRYGWNSRYNRRRRRFRTYGTKQPYYYGNTRPGRFKYKRKRKRSTVRFVKSKAMTRRRAAVALPPLELKRVEYQADWPISQYDDYGVAEEVWSARNMFDTVPIGDGENQRQQEIIKFLGFNCHIKFKQAVATEHHYRIMVVKFLDNHDFGLLPFQPKHLLSNCATTQEGFISGYKEADHREDIWRRVIVVKNITFTWNTNIPNQTFKRLSVKIPAHTVDYDRNEVDGTQGKGKMGVFIITTAPHSDPTFVYDISHRTPFIDS